MRVTPLAVIVVLSVAGALGGCAGDGARLDVPGPGVVPPLGSDVLPLEASVAHFVTQPPGELRLRTEPSADGEGATIWMEGDVPQGRRIDVQRTATGVRIGAGPSTGYELVREGALPGEAWESGGRTVTFDGWERVETPAGVFDAARIRTQRREGDVVDTEVWWLAAGSGIVRLEIDKRVFQLSMTRVR